MTILTSQTTFIVGEASTETVSVDVTILPAIGAGTGKGRLIHPTLGTYDYEHCPDEWSNMDGDVVVPPIWTSSKTLNGTSNTLMMGSIRDVVVEERWTGGLSASLQMVRILASFWQNPPDPATDYVKWYPNYLNANGYKVILTDLELNGQGLNFDFISRQGYVTGTLVLRMRIAGRV